MIQPDTGDVSVRRLQIQHALDTASGSPVVLPLCVALGAMLRVFVVLVAPVDPSSDAAWYFNRARELAQGLGYQEDGHPTAFWPVGYPAMLAGVFKLFGPSVLAGQTMNIVLWMATLVLLHRLVDRVCNDRRAANLAVLACSLHLNAVGFSALLLTEVTYTFLLVLCCRLALTQQSWQASALCGVLLGCMTLIKAQTWLFGVAWALLTLAASTGEPTRRRVAQATLMVALMFAVVMPWSIRNQQTLGAFVLVSTNGGISFAVGNHPQANGTDAWTTSPFRAEIGQSVADQVGADRRARAVTWQWIREHPGAFLALAPRKFYWAWLPDGESEWGFQSGFADYEAYRVLFRSARWLNQAVYFLILGGSLAGLVSLIRRRTISAAPLRPLVLLGGAYLTVFMAITFLFNGQSRYHYPLVPLMCAWGAIAWSDWRRTTSQKPVHDSASSP